MELLEDVVAAVVVAAEEALEVAVAELLPDTVALADTLLAEPVVVLVAAAVEDVDVTVTSFAPLIPPMLTAAPTVLFM